MKIKEIKRLEALEECVLEMLKTPYSEVRNNLAAWRATFEIYLDKDLYHSLEKMKLGKEHFTPIGMEGVNNGKRNRILTKPVP